VATKLQQKCDAAAAKMRARAEATAAAAARAAEKRAQVYYCDTIV
jgi:hypothetical protein